MRKTIIKFPNNAELGTISKGIGSGSLKITEILSSGGLEFGQANAAAFEAQIYDLNKEITGERIQVFQEVDGDTSQLFDGYVDSCTQNAHEYFSKIQAFDFIGTHRNDNVAGWWKEFWGESETPIHKTIGALAKSLLIYMDVPYTLPNSLPNYDLYIEKPANFDSLPFGTIIQCLGQAFLAFPHMTRQGVLEFKRLNKNTATAKQIDGSKYKKSESDFEKYLSASIDRVKFYNSDNELVAIAGSAGNTYSFEDNLLFHSLSKVEMQNIADSTLQDLKGFAFTPCKVKLIESDHDLQLGDLVQINNKKMYILNNTISGAQLISQEIGAEGEESYQGAVAYNAGLENSKEKVNQVLETLRSDYITAKDIETKYATVENLSAANASILHLEGQQAEFQELTTSKFEADEAEIENLKSTKIDASTVEAEYAKIDLANISQGAMGTAIIAQGGIENAWIQDGAINSAKISELTASKITSGEFDASKAIIKNLKAKSIQVEEINGKKVEGNIEDFFTADAQRMDSLQSQIDGAIETWQGSEPPTMLNYPVSDWTEAEYINHIGDVYYVVNPQSLQDGYTYRFYYDATASEYKWVLIKDNEITAALAEISETKQELTSFKSDTATFESNTNTELSRLAMTDTAFESRLDGVDESLNTKVESTVFNELSSTVDTNKATITSMSEVLKMSADGKSSDTINTITQRVTSVEETATGLSSSVSSLEATTSKLESQTELMYGYILEVKASRIEGGWLCRGELKKDGLTVETPNGFDWNYRNENTQQELEKNVQSVIITDEMCSYSGATVVCEVTLVIPAYLKSVEDNYLTTPSGARLVGTI